MAMPTGTLADTSDPTCLSCYSVLVSDKDKRVTTNCLENEQRLSAFSLCPNCDLPMCMTEKNEEENGLVKEPCHENQIHRDYECKLFQKRKIKLVISPSTPCHPFYNVILLPLLLPTT